MSKRHSVKINIDKRSKKLGVLKSAFVENPFSGFVVPLDRRSIELTVCGKTHFS
jgi:hypothetical protein